MDQETRDWFDEQEAKAKQAKWIPNEKVCANCKYKAQGEYSSFCNNPNQKDKDLSNYVYWNFSCDMFDNMHFEQMTDEEKIALGYTKAVFEWGYRKYDCWKPPIIKKP